MIIFAFIYQCNNKQNSIITTFLEWTILLSPFIIFLFFFIRDCKNEKYGNFKKVENNILNNKIIEKFHKIKNERKGKDMAINLNNGLFKKKRNSSFSNIKRAENFILSAVGDNISEEIDKSFKKQNDDIMNSIDFSYINMNNNNTRKTLIEMEYINKKDKNS